MLKLSSSLCSSDSRPFVILVTLLSTPGAQL